ncbi:hypothetical protein CVT25_012632 [Psilocybe cyanescens]|uniref:Uncharacterized protein n=1 Tax=Psilocybe cyanescens TaxID=93625 RepID=A0A409XUX9_PSICY|nr:hypothetical protein CVT25_012632 [Psilocybe cyanescens]
MATIRVLSIAIPPVPAAYKPLSVPSTSHISAPHPSGHCTLLPVGPAYINHLRLSLRHSHSFSSLDKHLAALHGEVNVDEDGLGVGEEEEPEELLALDPEEWKKDTTTTTVPSSLFLAGMNQNTNDDAFFKYILKGHEVLNNPKMLCQFNSVDPVFLELKEDMPTVAQIKSKDLKSRLPLLTCLQPTAITLLSICLPPPSFLSLSTRVAATSFYCCCSTPYRLSCTIKSDF